MDSKGKAAGKGLLIQENKASTLAVSQDQYVFAKESYGVPNPSYGVTTKGNGDAFCSEERHTAVSTGGGQAGQGYPCVIVPKAYGVPLNFRPENTKVYKETATTICNGTNPGHHQGVITYGIGNGQTGQMTADREISRTLDCMHDQKAIMTYSMQAIGEYKESDQGSALKARDYKDATDLAIDCRNTTEDHVNDSNNVCRQGYIVRRLTPTECCRLQGFPDGWADIDHKYKFSDEDYEFWSSIHSGTREQVRRWYNKLHTDSAEYKMWGNGIALPCALYVFEGIEEEIRLAHESPDVAND